MDRFADIITKAKKGDKEAFGDLYREFQERIYRYIFFLVYDEPLAEDITQNTFLKAWKSLPGYEVERGTFQSFLFTIARNLVTDHRRKKKTLILDQEAGEYISSGEDLEGNFINSEKQTEVKKALSCLSEFERQVIILRYFEDMSYSEISKIVGKKESAIRVRVHRALKVLKQKI